MLTRRAAPAGVPGACYQWKEGGHGKRNRLLTRMFLNMVHTARYTGRKEKLGCSQAREPRRLPGELGRRGLQAIEGREVVSFHTRQEKRCRNTNAAETPTLATAAPRVCGTLTRAAGLGGARRGAIFFHLFK